MNRSESSQRLKLASFPLHGLRLIEASAGTGKTYSIAALYVRLVLGHGRHEPLMPPQILVLTFTRAATKELRDRIRKRLTEMAQAFIILEHGDDDFVHEMLTAFPEAEERAACARRLRIAAEWMDEAAIHTIHAWCQTTLRQHAFDSGSLFDQEVEGEDKALMQSVVNDYWRRFMYIEHPEGERLSEIAGTPVELTKKFRNLLKDGLELRIDGKPASGKTPKGALDRRQHGVDQWLQPLKERWEAEAASARDFLRESVEDKMLKTPYSNWENCQGWFDAINNWDGTSDLVDQLGKLRASCIEKELSKKGEKAGWRADHPLLIAIDQTLKNRPRWTAEVWPHAAEWVREHYEREKLERNRLDFDDLLTQLDRALNGANQDRLRKRILESFPVALIDEFQDTDPVQYRIFERIFLPERNNPAHGLFMIGDPKQAIYAFRGADIYTYLAARRQTSADDRFTLPKNYRSTDAMIDAVNHLFGVGERQPDGAFGFRSGSDDPVPFYPVEAREPDERGRDERFMVATSPQQNALPAPNSAVDDANLKAHPALTFWFQPPDKDGGNVSKNAYQLCMAKATAVEITRLLNLGRSEPPQAVFVEKNGRSNAVRPSDMAVLVSNRYEADDVQKELRQRGVDSVYLSERNSIFDQPEAVDLLAILEAAANPKDARLVRNALAVPSLCMGLQDLDALNQHEERLDDEMQLFVRLSRTWRERGVLAMLRRLFTAKSVPSRLFERGAGGERALTNVLHLAELLQAENERQDGEQGLIDYLRGEVSNTERSDIEEHLLRLESDADLVKVITIFKSKGLQYPLVFVPFPCSYKALSEQAEFLEYHDNSGEHGPIRVMELAGGADAARRAQREKLQEQLRQFYVALTRSEHACWVGMAPILHLPDRKRSSAGDAPGLRNFAPGHLLLGLRTESEVDDEQDPDLSTLLDRLVQANPDVTRIDIDQESFDEDRLVEELTTQELGSAAEYQRSSFENWWIASYSALRHGKGRTGGADDANSAVEANLDEMSWDDQPGDGLPEPFAIKPEANSIHAFPRGATPGNFLHLLLEWAGQQGFARLLDAPDRMREEIARRLERRGWGDWMDAVTAWFETQLTAPLRLGDTELRLIDLAPDCHQYKPELEFWFAAHDADVLAIDQLVCTGTLDGRERVKFESNSLNGMLHGFIDLVFEHGGSWYVADYKSNWIGPTADYYTRERMSDVVCEHRYDMQYVFYTLALHRLLKSRLGPDYDPDRHLGGSAYLFLRGCENPETAGVFFEPANVELIEAIDELFAGREVSDVA